MQTAPLVVPPGPRQGHGDLRGALAFYPLCWPQNRAENPRTMPRMPDFPKAGRRGQPAGHRAQHPDFPEQMRHPACGGAVEDGKNS